MAKKLLKKSVLSVLTVVVTLILGIALTGSEVFHDPYLIPDVSSTEGRYVPAGADTGSPPETSTPETTSPGTSAPGTSIPETSEPEISRTETSEAGSSAFPEPTSEPGTASVTEPPETEPPVTEPPETEPPVTEPPVTEPPVTEPPAPVYVKSIKISVSSVKVTVGKTLKFTAKITPSDADNKDVSWSVVSGDEFASVNSSGTLTARAPGTVTVAASASDGSGVSAQITVTVLPITVSSISISTPIPYLHVGSNIKFTAAVSPANACDRSVSWSVTGGTGKAAIDENGVLTAAKAGTVKVTAKANDGSGVSVSKTVTVVGDSMMIIGISNMGSASKTSIYKDAVGCTGATSVVLPMISSAAEAIYITDRIDALIMTGGEDIDPSYYGESPSKKLGTVFAARDVNDILLIRYAVDRDLPMLAICRGMQILNVVCGGTLVQDIPTEIGNEIVHRDPALRNFKMHGITAADGSLISKLLGSTSATVNSWHHQAVENVGKDLTVTAFASDGVPEALEMEGKTFILGVQFHPERMIYDGNKNYVSFFNALVGAAKLARASAGTN